MRSRIHVDIGRNPNKGAFRSGLFAARSIPQAAYSNWHIARDLVGLPFSQKLGVASGFAYDFLDETYCLSRPRMMSTTENTR
jgi:hypothetical protein